MTKKKKATTQSAPPARGNGLRVMTPQDVEEYMTSLVQNKKANPPGLEGDVLRNFRTSSLELADTERRFGQARAEIEQFGDTAKRLQGHLDAYANLLVKAEDSRRAGATDAAD